MTYQKQEAEEKKEDSKDVIKCYLIYYSDRESYIISKKWSPRPLAFFIAILVQLKVESMLNVSQTSTITLYQIKIAYNRRYLHRE